MSADRAFAYVDAWGSAVVREVVDVVVELVVLVEVDVVGCVVVVVGSVVVLSGGVVVAAVDAGPDGTGVRLAVVDVTVLAVVEDDVDVGAF
ncbi:MAG TPA: hypothetical protein VGJ86_23615 [Acidimicrobiales bacterium]